MAYIRKKREISVVMGIYNCANTLKESIDSLLNQTFNDWELIMCDDASTDETLEIAMKYEESYSNILVLKNDKNLGLAGTLNKCLKKAHGTYIARQDGDDISLPTRFEKQINFLESNPRFALVSCPMIFFDENGDFGQSTLKTIPNKFDFVKGSPFSHAPCMIRRDVLNRVGNYTVSKFLRRGQDYYLWYKIYKNGLIGYNLSECLYKMRDDMQAIKRRKLIDRIYGAKIQAEVLYGLKLPFYSFVYVLISLIKGGLPLSIYRFFHRHHLIKNMIKK
jgi:glycosyltransferase EpsE